MLRSGRNMGEEEPNSGFVRQRRNLMIASLALLFSEVTELRIQKLSAFGNELLIGEPYAVTLALWVATTYWLFRFYQYSGENLGTITGNLIFYRVREIGVPTALRTLLRINVSLSEPFPDIPIGPNIRVTKHLAHTNPDGSLRFELDLTKSAAIEGEKAIAQSLGTFNVDLSRFDKLTGC